MVTTQCSYKKDLAYDILILKMEDGGGASRRIQVAKRRSWHFSAHCNDHNAKERIAAARENVQSVNETELPVTVCLSTHDKHCLSN